MGGDGRMLLVLGPLLLLLCLCQSLVESGGLLLVSVAVQMLELGTPRLSSNSRWKIVM